MAGERIARKIAVEIFNDYPTEVATIKPGHIVAVTAGKAVALASGTVKQPLRVALEDSYFGKEIKDTYKANTMVKTIMPRSGDVVQLRADAAIAKDAIVYKKAGGQVSTTPGELVGQAMTAASAADDLIDVEIA